MYLQDILGDAYKEGMTEEEISTALEKNYTSSQKEIDKLKSSLSKANSESAEWKKKLREKQTDDEAKAQAEKEAHEALLQELEGLKRDKALSEKKMKLLGMGYDEELATSTATAMIDGDMDTVLANQSKYLESQKKVITANQMRETPRPVSGSDGGDNEYSKLIADAQAKGDFGMMAYYTRLQHEALNPT